MDEMNPSPVSFDNTENAFAYRSDHDLRRAQFLFNTMHYNWIVQLGIRLTPLAIRLGLPIRTLLRNTLFAQFVGGESLEETARLAAQLGQYHVQVILDYGVEGGNEGEQGFDHATDEFIRVVDYAATQPNIPYMSIKVTGIARMELLEKLDRSVQDASGSLMKRYQNALALLSETEKQEWQRVETRLEKICATAYQKGVGVFIDAEETWIQDPVDVLAILMMEKFNRQKAIVYNTYQLYRHDRLSFLHDSLEAAELKNFILGAKLVRGAYMEKERLRAQRMVYASPIQPDKEASDRDYDAAIAFCIEHIERIAMVVASHNERSNLYATELMMKKGIVPHHPHVHFSQLYGMSDNITFNLAKAGYAVSKYLPFGPIKEVIPYLMRRAQENSSVSGQTGRELVLIRREMARRKRHRPG